MKGHKHKPHWYMMFVEECPVCGRIDEWRERRYTQKPASPGDRHSYQQVYDKCMEDYGYG